MSDDEIEIREPSEYTSKKDEVYSHSSLVMSALKVAQEKRAGEMRDGYYNTKFDKLGNAHRVWIGDSRDEFIQAVESLMMIQERDYDKDAVDNIKAIMDELAAKYKVHCEQEAKEWIAMQHPVKINFLRKGMYFVEGKLCSGLRNYPEYLRDKVEAYTKIYSEIQKSIKRIGDYGEELWEA